MKFLLTTLLLLSSTTLLATPPSHVYCYETGGERAEAIFEQVPAFRIYRKDSAYLKLGKNSIFINFIETLVPTKNERENITVSHSIGRMASQEILNIKSNDFNLPMQFRFRAQEKQFLCILY